MIASLYEVIELLTQLRLRAAAQRGYCEAVLRRRLVIGSPALVRANGECAVPTWSRGDQRTFCSTRNKYIQDLFQNVLLGFGRFATAMSILHDLLT